LESPVVLRGRGDFSFYDLSPGSEFRKYCDQYAQFVKEHQKYNIIFANVDAIFNPELTWKIQKYFEEEHGIIPVPVIHYGTPMEYLDRYLEAGKYDLIGIGGLGQGAPVNEYVVWSDEVFCRICPESNRFYPVVKTHGFAIASWMLICRYPWYSVDTATWVKYAAYGTIFVPVSDEDGTFQYDVPPIVLAFTEKSDALQVRGSHYLNCSPSVRRMADRWIRHLGLTAEQLASHYRYRLIANVNYLKDLEESRPPWPYPLDPKIIDRHSLKYRRGFGL